MYGSWLGHCSINAEAMGWNPVEVPIFFRVNLQLRRQYLHNLKFAFPQFTSSFTIIINYYYNF